MRLRYVKGARDLIHQHPHFIYDDQDQRAVDLASLFVRHQPIHVEIGTGKGQFIHTLAKQNPTVNYLGIEKFDSAVVKALYKLIEEPLDNLRLLRADATDLEKLFSPASFERIYLTFSDPWPKDRHAKRRLTSPRFLSMYKRLLTPQGEIHMKTDNDELFAYSLVTMEEQGLDILRVDYDLHKHATCDIIMTEFETKFVEQGVPIKYLEARFKEEHDG